MAPKEPVVSPATPMPKGYGFLKKGNVYATASTRRKVHAAKKTLYVVSENGKPVGLRAPIWILKEVHSEDRATKEERQNNVKKRDDATEKEFETAIRKLFPEIPEDSLRKVIKRALQKRSGRVGRSGALSVNDKVQLAVSAHVRHCHTQYDKLIRGPMSRDEARKKIKGEALRVLAQWRGARTTNESRRQRKTKTRRASATKQATPTKQTIPQKQTAPMKQAAPSAPPPKPSAKRGRNEQQPLPPKRRRMPTRSSSRLNNPGVENLKVLDVFLDDEEDSNDSDEDAEDEEDLDAFLDDFLVDDSEYDPESDWHSE